MKLRWSWNWEELRRRLVLTREEKRVIVFILATFVLGLGTKCYRDKHSKPAITTEATQAVTPTGSPVQKRKGARKSRRATPTPSVPTEPNSE